MKGQLEEIANSLLKRFQKAVFDCSSWVRASYEVDKEECLAGIIQLVEMWAKHENLDFEKIKVKAESHGA
jgi:hypothetical protein